MYWTDSGWRGRWNALRNPASRAEKMWENGQAVTNAAILPGTGQFVLLSMGKIDFFRLSKYEEAGGPAADLSMVIELPNDEQTGGKWELMVPDVARESLWVGNDEGVLVEVSADEKSLHLDSVIKLHSGSFKFSTAGVVVGDSLVLLDTASLVESRVLIVQLATNCPLGPEVACKCRPMNTKQQQQQCIVTSDSLHGLVHLPPHVTALFPKDVTVESGARIVMGLSSRLQAQESLTIKEGVVLEVSDPRRRVPAGPHGIVEAVAVHGMFASVAMDHSMQLSRLFFCFQFPKLQLVATGTSMTAHFSTVGQYCVSPMLTMPLLFGILGALLYWSLFGCSHHLEKPEHKRR